MNYRRFAPLCALVLCVSLVTIPAAASQAQAAALPAALPADAPSRDQVMTLMDLLQVRRSMQQMIAGMKDGMKAAALQALKRDVRDPSQKQIDRLNMIVDTAFEDLKLDDFIGVTITVYQRHLFKADIDEMIRFYNSPTGQKLLREQPQMLQESMQAAQKLQQEKMGSIMDKIERRMKESSDEDSPASKQPATK